MAYEKLSETVVVPGGPVLPKLQIPAPASPSELTPRSAGAAVERALAERELAATKAAQEAQDAIEAQLTARAQANAAAETARAAAKQAAAATEENSNYSKAQSAAAEAKAAAEAAEIAANTTFLVAQSTARKAAVQAGFVAASTGHYVLVSGKLVELFETEAQAMVEASSLWWPWILYHSQRGSYTEVASGGVGIPFAHSSMRRNVAKMMNERLNYVYGRMGE